MCAAKEKAPTRFGLFISQSPPPVLLLLVSWSTIGGNDCQHQMCAQYWAEEHLKHQEGDAWPVITSQESINIENCMPQLGVGKCEEPTRLR